MSFFQNLGACTLGLSLFVACSPVLGPRPQNTLTLLSWNVQNLFDDLADGGEYPEFVPGPSWGQGDFLARCQKISEVIRALPSPGADLLAFQEIENEHVLQVLRDRFFLGLGYRWSAITPGAGIHSILLSRYPLTQVGAFSPSWKGQPGRPLLEALVTTPAGPVVLLVNHWKSRLPNPEETEDEREESAKLLNQRLMVWQQQTPLPLIVAVGDFNTGFHEEPSRSWQAAKNPGADRPQSWLSVWDKDSLALQAGWGWSEVWDSSWSGSYYWHGQWSRLDHVLIASCSLRSSIIGQAEAGPFTTSIQLTGQGTPRPWSVRDRKGVSDHLPLYLRLTLTR